jgi:hypothetical protein
MDYPIEKRSYMVCPLAKSMAWVNHWPIFMSHMLRLVLVVFRAFPKPTGYSTRHERDMQHELPPALGGILGRQLQVSLV